MKFAYSLACLPYTIAIMLFYSVAIHIYNALGGWPESIGTRGFPETLLFHINIQNVYLSYLLGFTVFLIPIIIIICSFVKKWRFLIKYLSIQIIGLIIFFLQMFFVPDEYIYWFWATNIMRYCKQERSF